MSRFRLIDRDTDFLLPPSVQEWLPEAHLARYVAAVVEGLDLSDIERAYAGRGSDAYHPATLLSLLIYGYATGTFSSCKIERATYDSLAFRYIACNRHPDHDTLATFCRRFGKQFESSFVQVLQIAHDNQFSSFGTVSFDGTKIHANASRHSALSYEHAVKLEAQLKAEVHELFALAEAADQADVPDGMSVPDEIARREDQIKAITQARAKIEARAKERYAREKGEFDAKIAARETKEAETGKKLGGRKPTPPTETPRPEDQINLTDDESRIMKVAGGGFEQCYNAQFISIGRDAHHPDWKERFTEPALLPANATPVEKMKHTLKTKAGKATYALRKQTVEPVFGIIKSVMGFRQFMLRGLEKVGHEWALVCLAWNLKRMAVLRQNSVQSG